jgi:hypothetical protein
LVEVALLMGGQEPFVMASLAPGGWVVQQEQQPWRALEEERLC